MICSKCHIRNDDNASFCIQCGAPLDVNKTGRNYEDMRRSTILVLILLAWELFTSLCWLLIQKALIPLMTRGLDLYSYEPTAIIYKVTGLFFDIVSVALGIVFLILARYMPARAVLIAYVSVRALLLIIYRVSDIF